MREPDPEVIRMIAEGMRLQIPGIPNDVTLPRALVPDAWVDVPAPFREGSDMGVDGHRMSERLDNDEPAARRDEWRR